MRLLVIGNPKQPIPPINGGAVENLVKMFYETNENKNGLFIDVISCADDRLDINYLNSKYENVRFHKVQSDIKYSKIEDIIYYGFYKVFKKLWIRKSCFAESIINYLNDNKIQFDAILIENYIEAVFPLFKAFSCKKIYLHLHNDKLNSNIIGGKRVASSCEKIITVSDYIKQRVEMIPEARNKTITLVNSIDVDKFGKDNAFVRRNGLREKYCISEQDILLLFAGRVTKTKGVLELIEAITKVSIPNVKLIIIGNSWYGNGTPSDEYMMRLQKASIAVKDKIIFTGYVDYEHMPFYYAMADIVVIPSIWQEPCSLTLFETMASKIPLITTKTGGTPEVVKDYAIVLDTNTNFVFNLTSAIEELATDSVLRDKMADRAYAYVQRFNPNRYYEKLKGILMEADNV